MRRLLIVVVALLACLSASGLAWAQSPYPYCDGSFYSEALDHVDLYRVRPARAYFRGSINCPPKTSCLLGGYVIAKDTVLVSKIEKGWACVLYPSAKYRYIGWIPVADLVKLPSGPIKGAAWVGTWNAGEDTQITIARDGRGLKADGFTTTPPPFLHSGGFEGALKVDGLRAVLRDANYDGCIVRFRRFDRYLIADDNDHCGGQSADMSGVYTR